MKIKLFVLASFMFISTLSFSQISGGNILIGGNVQFQNSEVGDFQSISIVPNGHYFLNDKFSVGGNLGFVTRRNNIGTNDFVRTNTMILGPEVRYYYPLGENVNLYGGLSFGFSFGGSTAVNGNNQTDLGNTSDFNLGLNPGILFTPSEKIGFNFQMNFIRFTRNSVTPAGSNTSNVANSFNFGINTLAPAFGLYYIL